MKFFIQEMDKQYQPQIISKSVATQDLSFLGSHVTSEHWTKRGFPYIFIDKINYNNQTIRFGTLEGNALKYIIIDIRKSTGWQGAQTLNGLTEEECEAAIQIRTKSTPVGDCLTKFSVDGFSGGYGEKRSKEAFKNTTDIEKIRVIDIESTEIEYINKK
jgi:hypothetical protein